MAPTQEIAPHRFMQMYTGAAVTLRLFFRLISPVYPKGGSAPSFHIRQMHRQSGNPAGKHGKRNDRRLP